MARDKDYSMFGSPPLQANNVQTYKICMAMSTMVEALGMQAQNQTDVANGKHPAYDRDAFDILLDNNRMLQQQIVEDLLNK